MYTCIQVIDFPTFPILHVSICVHDKQFKPQTKSDTSAC